MYTFNNGSYTMIYKCDPSTLRILIVQSSVETQVSHRVHPNSLIFHLNWKSFLTTILKAVPKLLFMLQGETRDLCIVHPSESQSTSILSLFSDSPPSWNVSAWLEENKRTNFLHLSFQCQSQTCEADHCWTSFKFSLS